MELFGKHEMTRTMPFVACIYAATQSLWAMLLQTVPSVTDTHTILGIVSIVNSVLSIGVIMGAISLAYGYGKLNARVEFLEKEEERRREHNDD